MPWDLGLILDCDNAEWEKLISDLDRDGLTRQYRQRSSLNKDEREEIRADSFLRLVNKIKDQGDTWENCEDIRTNYEVCIGSAAKNYLRKNFVCDCPNTVKIDRKPVKICGKKIRTYDTNFKYCPHCHVGLNKCTFCKKYFLAEEKKCDACGLTQN